MDALEVAQGPEHEASSKPELARLFGFQNIRDINRIQENGIIVPITVKEGGKNVVKYDLEASVKSYVVKLRDKAAGREKRDTEAELKNQKLKAEIALKESQGELHRLRTEIAQGRYVDVDEIRLDLTKFFVVFKQFATGIPARVMARFSGVIDPVEARRIETELLGEVSGQLKAFARAARIEGEDADEDGTQRGKAAKQKRKGKNAGED